MKKGTLPKNNIEFYETFYAFLTQVFWHFDYTS